MPEPMLCPIDKTPLVMSERQNIEIDYCPTCRGVWLDRGELDKIIEKNAAAQPAAVQAAPVQAPRQDRPQDGGQWAGQPRHNEQYGYSSKPHKRRKSFLEDLFD